MRGRNQSGGGTESGTSVNNMNRVILSPSHQMVQEPMAVVVVCAGTNTRVVDVAVLSSSGAADFRAENCPKAVGLGLLL